MELVGPHYVLNESSEGEPGKAAIVLKITIKNKKQLPIKIFIGICRANIISNWNVDTISIG